MTHATSGLLGGSIYDEQIKIEQQANDEGVARYNRLAKEAIERGDGASLKPAERLLLYWFQPIVDGVRADQKAIASNGHDVGIHIWGPVIANVDAEKLAVIALHEVISQCMKQGEVLTVELANHIGRGVYAELNMAAMREQDKDTRKRRTERLESGEPKKTVYAQERELVADLDRRFRSVTPGRVNWFAKKTLADAHWNKQVCTHVGTRLLWHVLEAVQVTPNGSLSLAQQFRKAMKGKAKYHVKLEQWVIDTIDAGHDMRKTMRPRYLPMIVPPYAWSDDAQGGYIQTRTPFVSKPTRDQKEALEKADLSSVNQALTAISGVAWRINRRILEVMREFQTSGGGILGVPYRDNVPAPTRPKGYDAAAPQKERWVHVPADEKKAYKRESARVIAENIRRVSARQEFFSKLGIADRFADREAIYFPHQFDFRGRLYAIPIHLNHQGDDVCRGLLEFSEGKELGADGLRWLKIHAANCYGMDKCSFDDRVAWVNDHMAEIEDCAEDPLRVDFWHHADESTPGACDGKPWQFLAACIALTDPEAAMHLPVQVDGTCNGLQHYTAIGRDQTAAKSVNMLPGDKPESVYVDVADVVDPIVRREARANPIAAMLIDRAGKIGKPLVKQPVMTTTYGVTAIGARGQIATQLEELGFEGDELYDASRYLSGVVLKGIGGVCESAVRIMDWIRACAKLIVAKDRLVTWTSPIGFPVVQPYRNFRPFHVHTVLGKLEVVASDETAPVHKQQQINGSAPNFVHSIDATHLMLTATACANEGITLAAVHDAYWSHAGSMDDVTVTLRHWFVEMHKRDLLGDLVTEWRTTHTDIEFPDPPTPGTYAIDDVMRCPYFFH